MFTVHRLSRHPLLKEGMRKDISNDESKEGKHDKEEKNRANEKKHKIEDVGSDEVDDTGKDRKKGCLRRNTLNRMI